MATSNSELYEFDAPSHVVDLKELANTDIDDKWFGESPSTHTFLYVCMPQQHFTA